MGEKSIEQEIRNKNFGIRNGNFEKNAVVKNQGTKQRVQRIIGDCWQWETNGQCVKGDNCSFRHDTNKRGKVTPSNPSPNSFMQQSERKSSRTRSPEAGVPVVERLDGLARISFEELARTKDSMQREVIFHKNAKFIFSSRRWTNQSFWKRSGTEMILSKSLPTYSLSVYEMMIFRNSIQSGTEIYCL